MKVFYFAQLKELIGKSEDEITLSKSQTILEVINRLKEKSPLYSKAFNKLQNLKYAVNCEYVDLNHKVSDKDEIAFFPPVTGGWLW